MKLLLDANGVAVLRDGKPVYVRDGGKEIEFDGAQAFEKIGQLTGENAATRKRAEEAEARLKLFEGIEDPDLARKALETTKNLDDGKLILANKVEEIKAAAQKTAQDQVAAASKMHLETIASTQAERDKLRQELNDHIIGGGFSRTKLITDDKHPSRLVIPADMAQAYFGRNFKVEDGKAVGYDAAGNKLYSPTRPGEVADFDEALEQLVSRYPNKDSILKGSGATGSGANTSVHAGGKRVVTRASFNAMDPQQQATIARDKSIVLTD